MDIIKLFPKVISISYVDNCFDDDYKLLKNNYDMISIDRTSSDYSERSLNLTVLKDFPKLELNLLEKFLQFNDQYLKHSSDFKITTSWITKTGKNQQSTIHSHKNSFYSGVLYFDDTINMNETGKLELINMDTSEIFPGYLKEFNDYNSSIWSIFPQKNLIILFPSNTFHKISLHKSTIPRYSLAFNIFPVGDIGLSDSSLNIELK